MITPSGTIFTAFDGQQHAARCHTVKNTLPLCFRTSKRVDATNRWCIQQTMMNLRMMGVTDQMIVENIPASLRKTLVNRDGTLRSDLESS